MKHLICLLLLISTLPSRAQLHYDNIDEQNNRDKMTLIRLDDERSWWNDHWYWVVGATAFVGGLAQVKDAPIAFAALEAGGAFYMMNEWYNKPNEPLAKLITPLALTTLALVNLTLLREDDTTRGDVFRYNAAGLSLISLNYFWSY